MEKNPKTLWLGFAVGLVIALGLAWLTHCGSSHNGPTPAPTPTPAPQPAPPSPPSPPPVACDPSHYGQTQDRACPAPQTGTITAVCTDQGLIDVKNACVNPTQPTPPAPPAPPTPPPAQKPCDQVTTFDRLQPVIALNCASCHQGRDQYGNAKAVIEAMIARIQIKAGQPQHMPAGRPDLGGDDIAKFVNWKADGLLKANDCINTVPPPAPPFRDLGWLEQQLFQDINKVAISDQRATRYLVAVDQLNKNDLAGLQLARDAAVKAVNSVSFARHVQPLRDVAPGIWSINLTDLEILIGDWQTLENASQLQFESFTQTGKSLKAIVNSRLPWVFVQDFNDTALRNATVYYRLTHAPATLQVLLEELGVNFAGDLADFKALLLGFNGSALSPAANRLISRHDSANGAFWATYDTGPIVSPAQNLFNNPLLKEAGGQANLKFAAGEQLYTLPNGLIGSFLADFNGKRLDQADPNVVHDFTFNPVAPIIKNAISCFRCHNGGFIHAVDTVRGAVNTANIGADDTQRVIALFKPQTTVDRLYATDNSQFNDAMHTLGLDPAKPDPISAVSDKFLGDWSLQDAAAQLILTPDQLTTCINLSAQGKAQVGQLLSGGTVSHDQFVQAVDELIRDCRLFQDPLTQ